MTLKRSLAALLAALLLLSSAGLIWLLQPPCGTIVLAYHSISDEPFSESEHLFVTPAELEDQVRWLKRFGYEFLFADEFRVEPGKKLVCITFDDGYRDNLTQAMPILQRCGAKGTVFVATKNIGLNEYCLCEDDIRALGESACMRVGSHTDGHYLATNLSDEDFVKQLALSKKRLVQLTGKDCRCFAFPGGYYDEQKTMLAAQYYDFSYTYPGTVWAAGTSSDTARLPRITVNRGTSGLKLLLMIRRAEQDPGFPSTKAMLQAAQK